MVELGHREFISLLAGTGTSPLTARLEQGERMRGTSLPLKRRAFMAPVDGAGVAWPLAARAPQPAMPVIGFPHSASPETSVIFGLNPSRDAREHYGHHCLH